MAQFLEVGVDFLSKLNLYHMVACFPRYTYWGDIQSIIKYVIYNCIVSCIT